MYHSVTFYDNYGSMNTFSDWHLVPDGRQVIVLPEVKTITVDVPGANGTIDLSESLTKYPVYGMRSGSLSFHVLNDYEPLDRLYSKIANFLHNQSKKLKLEDDPDFYYNGFYTVNWSPGNDGTWSKVDIGYYLEPYKFYKNLSTVEDSSMYNITVNSSTVTKTYTGLTSIGTCPVVPEFEISNIGTNGISITVNNSELGISNLTKTISSNGTRKFYDVIFSNIRGNNPLTLSVSGKGTVAVKFRRSSL